MKQVLGKNKTIFLLTIYRKIVIMNFHRKIYGVVKGSTGILKHEERAASDFALKSPKININANKNLAYAA